MAESVAMKGAIPNISLFTREKPQHPAANTESTSRLANVQIHVERVIEAV